MQARTEGVSEIPGRVGEGLHSLVSDDAVLVFGEAYVAWAARGKRFPPAVEQSFREFKSWLEKQIKNFERLPPHKRWSYVERKPRAGNEIPFLNNKESLVVYGPSAELARKVSPTFKAHFQAQVEAHQRWWLPDQAAPYRRDHGRVPRRRLLYPAPWPVDCLLQWARRADGPRRKDRVCIWKVGS